MPAAFGFEALGVVAGDMYFVDPAPGVATVKPMLDGVRDGELAPAPRAGCGRPDRLALILTG